ncbi:acetyltransferase-like isoleucine patch superfamily enzyme [Polaribacter sp. Hel1_33_96]|jgi:acetyltransferase-like isoleucine patch superfamily enzyme|nr:acetyltransferase-like isoleucine patch superfamily enzyme [Polaribacter sp. Hel1_33_96]
MISKLLIFFKKGYTFLTRRIMIFFYSFQFKKIGKNSVIHKQLILNFKKGISIGDRVVLMPNSRIELITKYANEKYQPQLIINDFSQIHQNCHITCAEEIKIGKNVIIVANVTITDIIHPHEDISIPINKAKIKTFPVEIGDETYVYNNAVILPGVKIGKHCIIGANSVVNSNIPDYSIAVGNPAKVIKQYNFKTKKWERV